MRTIQITTSTGYGQRKFLPALIIKLGRAGKMAMSLANRVILMLA
jgi:hypothetical protein